MENLVNALDGCGDGEACFEIIKQISQYFEGVEDYGKIDQYLSTAFPENDGIIAYLRSQVTVKSTDKARDQGYQLIVALVHNPLIPKHVLQPYCLNFWRVADLARKNIAERAKIQCIALDCIQAILEKFGTALGAVELEASALYWSLLRDSEKSAFQPTVRGKMFHIMGLLARLFSAEFLSKDQDYLQLFNHLVFSMKAQVDSSNHHMEAAILLGTVKGVDQFLLQFYTKIDPEYPSMSELYEKLEQIIDPKCSIEHDKATLKLKRREFQRAGLDLIANHGDIFQKHLYNHYEQWFRDLLSWARSNNMDDLRVGMRAVFKFLEVVCNRLRNLQDGDDPNQELHGQILNFFTYTFRDILDNKDCHKSELTIAIKGIGLVVDVCQDTELKDELFTKILKHVEAIITEFAMPDRDKYSRSASLIPTYLEALGNMLLSTQVLDESTLQTFQSRLNVIENLAGLLVSHYPDLGEKYRRSCPYSFLKVIQSLYTSHSKWLQTFLENIISESLRQIISCPTQVEVDILIESYQRSNQSNVAGSAGPSRDSEREKKAVGNKLGLKTLHSFLPFWIDLVNIAQSQVGVAKFIYNSIVQWALVTIARLDLSIEFLDDDDQDSLSFAQIETFSFPMDNAKAGKARDFQLFVNLVDFLQEFALKTPISYFQEKWVEVFLSEMLTHIETHPYVSGFYKIVGLIFDIMRETEFIKKRKNAAESLVVVQKANNFLNSLSSKAQEYRDDLLLSVLNNWLSAPNELVVENLSGLSVTLKIIFQTGRNCFPVAVRGIQAVERWFAMSDFPPDTMEKLFNELFPIWKSYFTCAATQNPTLQDNRVGLSKKTTKASRSKLAQRRLMRMRTVALSDTTLNSLQLSILKLIGSYGHFLNVNAEENSFGRMSMEEKFLKYSVPFQDIKPDLYLDSVLPRILVLCQHGASERQVRCSACECFHTLVLYFLGHSANTTQQDRHPELFQKIFTTLMKLGSDSDVVIRQLFNPLTIQIVHWYTKGRGLDAYGEIILHAIMDSLAQSEDSPLRDFATVCIAEYFSWSLKHGNLEKVEAITKTLSAMSTHAGAKYRQGSVLAFNSIYREFRENDTLVNKYTFFFTYSFIVSLGLPSDFDEDSILIRSTKQALRHLERIILKKKGHFNTPIRGRKLPAELNGDCLRHLVDWIFGHSVKAELIGRNECFRLVSVLAPNIKDIGSLDNYLYKLQDSRSSNYLVSMIENLSNQDTEFNQEDRNLNFLAVCADVYDFLTGADFPVEKLLTTPTSKFVSLCREVLQNSPSSFEQDSSLSLRFFTKLASIISKSKSSGGFDASFRESLLFNSVILSTRVKVGKEVSNLVSLWSNLLPEPDNGQVMDKLKPLVGLGLSQDDMSVKQISETHSKVEWLQVLSSQAFLQKVLSVEEMFDLNNRIWEFIQSKLFRLDRHGSIGIKPVSIRLEELLQNLLTLAVNLGIEGHRVVEAVFDPSTIKSKDRIADKNTQKLTKGEVFQRTLLPALCHCAELLDFKKLTDNVSIEQVGLLIQNLLIVVKNKHRLRKGFGTTLVENTLVVWKPLHLNCDPKIIAKIISGLSSLNMQLCRNSVSLSEWWGGPKMMSSPHLNIQEKAEFIHFFGLFALSNNKTVVENVVSAMEQLVKLNLEPRPSLKWSQEENYFLQVFFKLLLVFEEIPENLKLLQVLVHFATKAALLSEIEIASRIEDKSNESGKENPCALEIKTVLEKVVGKNENGSDVLPNSIANTIIAMLFDEKLPHCRLNRVTSKFCLIPVIACMTEKTAKKFFKENIGRIIRAAETPASTIPELHARIAAFSLIEMLAFKTSSDFIKSPELFKCYQDQVAPYQSTTGKESAAGLQKTILSVCQSMRKNPIPTQRDDNLRKLSLLCNGSAFNALAAILKATDSDERFYTGFIFYEKPATAIPEGLWANLVDASALYTFPVIFDPSVAKKINIEKTPLVKPTIETHATSETKQVILPESSLAADASKYDFTTVVKVATNEFYRQIYSGAGSTGSTFSDPRKYMEWNSMNEHECMLALIQSIRQMKNFKFTEACPVWAKELSSQFEKPGVHANVKAFLVAALINCEDVIQPFAKYFIEPIINTILANCYLTSGGPESGETLNHFVKDIIVMLLGWSDTAKPAASSAKKLLEFCINRTDFHRKDVFDHNLEILQTVVKRWHSSDGSLSIPYELVREKLESPDPRFGLNICKAILLGNQLPCQMAVMPAFLDKLSRGFVSTSKGIYSLTGEVCGLLLRHLDGIKFEFLGNAISRLKEKKLDKIRDRPQPFMVILANIKSHFPAFLLSFKSELIGLVRVANIQSEVMSLLVQILSVELSNEDDEVKKERLAASLFADLEGRGIFRSDCKNDSDCKSGVELLNLIIRTEFIKNEAKIKQLITWAQPAEHSSDPNLRASYASAISWIYTHLGGHNPKSEISSKSEKMFIRLYRDEDEKVQEIVNEFWSRNLKSWTKSPLLILELMETLADDQNAIPVSLDLILKRCSLSPDFGKLIFDKPLADCQFVSYELDTSWRLRNFSFQPLFAESLSTSQNFSFLPPALKSTLTQRKISTQFGMNMLRATLNNLQFTPTQGSGGNVASLNNISQPMEADSYDDANRFPSQQAAIFRSPAEVTEEDITGSNQSLKNLRKHFYERPQSHVFARREIERQHVAIETQVDDLRQRRSGVRLARSYRIGELPDIMIKNSDFLLTIGTLAKVDEEFGKTFLVTLFTSIVKEIAADSDSNRLKTFRYNANITIDKLFRNYGSQLSSKFAAALLEISVLNDISVKVNLVSNISRAFDLQVLGILKLEHGLRNSTMTARNAQDSKRAKLDAPLSSGAQDSRDLWLRVGELYKDLEDFDTVRSIFAHIGEHGEGDEVVVNYFQKAREALYLESRGKYREALDYYDELYTEESQNPDPNLLLVQFWDDAMYKVMASLSDWNERYRKAHASYILHIDELNNENYRDRVLPHQIISGIQVLLREEKANENTENFKGFLDTIRGQEEEWKELTDTFPTEFCILSQIEGEPTGRSASLMDSAWAYSLKTFQFFEKLSGSQKKNQILELQKTSALMDALEWTKCSQVSINDVQERSISLLNKWRRSCSSSNALLMNADIVMTQRNYFLRQASEKVQALTIASEVKDELWNSMEQLYFEQNLWVVEVAALNGNAEVGNCYLRKAKDAGEGLKAKKLLLLAQLLSSCDYTPDVWVRQWCSVWKTIPRLKSEDPSTLWKAQSELLKSLILKQNSEPLSVDCVGRLIGVLNCPPNANLMEALIQNSIDIVGKATGDVASSSSQGHVELSTSLYAEDISMKFYHLLKTIMEKYPEHGKSEVLLKRLLISLLHGMKTGLSEAMHYFPTCFPWLEAFPSLVETFAEHMSEIKTWMFIPWLDQIVTNYRHNEKLASILKPILERLVRDYPQAFQMQYSEFLERTNSSLLVCAYKKALSALVLPTILFEKYIKSLESKFHRLELKMELERLLLEFEKIMTNADFFGKIHQDYANEIYPQVQEKLRFLATDYPAAETSQSLKEDFKNCETIRNDVRNMLGASNTIKKNVLDSRGQPKPYLSLDDLSPWLSKFHFAGFKDQLEIPGQFTQFRKPDDKLHAKIVSFEQTVKVFKSKTRPLCLTMMGNNGKKYHFLVKYGDDLRQDKRVQQLFDLSNEILKTELSCRQRGLGLLTYCVIPLSEELGMIEMVRRVESLKGFMFNSQSKLAIYSQSNVIYQQWIDHCAKGIPRTNSLHQYGKVAMKSRPEVEFEFSKVIASVPSNMFQKQVLSSSECQESYFPLRNKLIRSHATMSLVHWLLGIGDRHLENCMISLETGQFLGIDFGLAFGSGAILLPVPELVPFRLTPQIQDFLCPYGEKGLFKETMMYAWRALVKSSELLTAVAEVFVMEPTVTWARKAQSKLDFIPANKRPTSSILPIDVLKSKLEGANPVKILSRLLQEQKHTIPEYIGHWVNVAEDDRRDLIFKEKLVDEELIDLLLSLACDKNVLGRAWIGWSSWV